MAETRKKKVSAPERPGLPRVLPWHASALALVRNAWAGARMPHALLLHGPEGIGKRELARWIAGAVLCESSAGGPLDVCGQCASCGLLEAGSHPDFHLVTPEEDKQQISIEQVRAAADVLARTSYRQGGWRVVILDPAHQMTVAAANSVLKTLEEPGAASLLVLVTPRPSALPATVRSRCQKLAVRRPSEHEAIEWLRAEAGTAVEAQVLQFAGGAPLRALAYAEGRFRALDEQMQQSLGELMSGKSEVTQVARTWADEALNDRLTWLDLWLSSMARQAIVGTDDRVTFPARQTSAAHLPSPAGALNITAVFDLVDRVRTLKAQLARTALQRELAIVSLLVAILGIMAPALRGAHQSR